MKMWREPTPPKLRDVINMTQLHPTYELLITVDSRSLLRENKAWSAWSEWYKNFTGLFHTNSVYYLHVVVIIALDLNHCR